MSCFGEPGEEALALLAQPTAVEQSHLNSRFKRCERICETELQQVKSACEFAGCSLLVRSLRRGCSWPGGMLCCACAVVRLCVLGWCLVMGRESWNSASLCSFFRARAGAASEKTLGRSQPRESAQPVVISIQSCLQLLPFLTQLSPCQPSMGSDSSDVAMTSFLKMSWVVKPGDKDVTFLVCEIVLIWCVRSKQRA